MNASMEVLDPAGVAQQIHAISKKFSTEVERIRNLFDYHLLRTSQFEVSVDGHELLEMVRLRQLECDSLESAGEMMTLLQLLAVSDISTPPKGNS
jgi:hypothetical protein